MRGLLLYLMVCSSFSADPQGLLTLELSKYLGIPYRFGGTDETGYDCAGFVRSVYRTWGFHLPRTTRDQYTIGEFLRDPNELRPGDLVFFRNTYRKGISHVGIWTGDGKFIHASSHQGVVITSLKSPYFENRFAGGRRIDLFPIQKLRLTKESVMDLSVVTPQLYRDPQLAATADAP